MASTLDDPGTAPVVPAKFAHVVLRTNNYAAMCQFYCTFFGGVKPRYESDMMCLLTYDSEHHRVGILNMPHIANKQRESSGLEHIAYTYASLGELALSYLQRKNDGILPFWCTNHGPTTSVYYKDPDGNIIETQVDNLSVEEADAFMRSDEYHSNPIGVDFDMDDLIKRLRSGEDRASIMKRPDIGSRGIDTVPEYGS
ncbi:hypothetical protein DV736_g5832, partial [Chaetothyriales sp. CBS 134916]